MMLGSKGILTPMIHGLLRISCSRNPKNIRNPYMSDPLFIPADYDHVCQIYSPINLLLFQTSFAKIQISRSFFLNGHVCCPGLS